MYKEISAKDLNGNLIERIADEWMLITAGDKNDYNMMTASWGYMGELWGSDSVCVFVRPTRHTLKFLNEKDYFTLSFYGDNKQIHSVCGKLSGRDVNKTELANLTPVFDEAAPYFEEANTVIICKKQYADKLSEEKFTDKEPLNKWYDNDLHYFFIGKIEKVLIKE